MAYATLQQLRDYLKIPTAQTGDDTTLLSPSIARAQSIIERVTSKVYEASIDSTKRFDAVRDVCGAQLFFDNQWIISITSVTNGDGVSVSSSSYVTEPRNTGPWYGLRMKASASSIWTFSTDPEDAIAIVGKWAYALSAPDYIVQATIRLAAYLYRQKDNAGGEADRPLLTGDGVTIMPQALPADVLRLIEMDIPRGR